MPRCIAKASSTGKRCTKNAKEGEHYCTSHAHLAMPPPPLDEPPKEVKQAVEEAAKVDLPSEEEEEPEPEPKDTKRRKLRIKRTKTSRPPSVMDGDCDVSDEVERLQAKVKFLSSLNNELMRVIKSMNALKVTIGNEAIGAKRVQALTPKLQETTAMWMFYRAHKNDEGLHASIRAHMKQVNLDPHLTVNIPYQYVKIGTDLMFKQLPEDERDAWMDRAALKLIAKGAKTSGFTKPVKC